MTSNICMEFDPPQMGNFMIPEKTDEIPQLDDSIAFDTWMGKSLSKGSNL